MEESAVQDGAADTSEFPPLDRDRLVPAPGGPPAEVGAVADGAARDAARRPAGERGVPEWVVAAAGWLAARYRWSRQERFDVPAAGGAVQLAVSGTMPFGELLAQVSALEAGARAAVRAAAAGPAGGVGADGEPVDADRWTNALRALLRDAAGNPQARVDELAMMTEAEAAAQAAAVDERRGSLPDLALVHHGFEEAARAWPDAVAVEAGSGRVGYRELDRRANRLAWSLRELGVGPESLVGVCVDRSVELAVALLAVAKAGAAVVPLDQRMPIQRIGSIVADAPLPVVIVQEELRSRLESVPVLLLAEPAEPLRPGEATAPPETAVAMENAAFCYYTSGSTGEPKGVVTDHRCASGRLAWLRRRYPLEPGDRVVHKTPLIFDVAIWEIFGTLATGATVLMADPGAEADVDHLSRLLTTERTRFVHFVPSMLSAFLDAAPARSYPGLRWVQVSGEAVPAALLDRFAGHFTAEFHNMYGQTETSEVAAWEGRVPPDPARVPIGTGIGPYRLLVLDGALRPVPPGVPGELCVAGVGGLARGYHRRPGLTAERFVSHPYPLHPGERLYRTGDLVAAATDGTLTHLGRLDAQLKIRGCRVETGEVEAVLSRHPQVRQCAVVARPDDQGIDQLVAYVVADGLPVNRLAAHASRYLPGYMLPETYVALDALPLTAAGKTDRHSLPAPTPADRAARVGSEPPQGPVEEALAGLWEEVLGIATVGRADNFFDVGGNSLRSLQVLIRIRAVFDVDVRVSEFFAAPTIQALATSIEHAMADFVAGLSEDETAHLLAESDG